MKCRIDLASMDNSTLEKFLSRVRGLMDTNALIDVEVVDAPYIEVADDEIYIGITEDMEETLMQIEKLHPVPKDVSVDDLIEAVKMYDGFIPEE